MTIRRFMHRSRKDEDFAEEIEAHLAHEQDVHAERGLTTNEARRQARLFQSRRGREGRSDSRIRLAADRPADLEYRYRDRIRPEPRFARWRLPAFVRAPPDAS